MPRRALIEDLVKRQDVGGVEGGVPAADDFGVLGGVCHWARIGRTPYFAPPLRLAEYVATLALAQDNAFGQPLESQLRSCLLAMWLCEEAGVAKEVGDATYWVALLRYIGSTGHAHEVATVFGDEIAIRARTLVHDAANPEEVMRDVLEFATAGRAPEEREQIVLMIQQGAHEWAVHNFASGCEVGDMLVERLGFGPDVRDALRRSLRREGSEVVRATRSDGTLG